MKLVFFITKQYSVPIIEPLRKYCMNNAISYAWFKAGGAQKFEVDGLCFSSNDEVLNFNPDAVIVPGNIVPDFWPGIKVQIFHGLCEEKRGHYDITGFFDLYCTPGPIMTEKFKELKKKHDTFLVKETGWPKMDYFCSIPGIKEMKKKMGFDVKNKLILYAPTFSPKYTSAEDLFDSIKNMQSFGYQWVTKFHELEKNDTVKKYKTIESDSFHISSDFNIFQWMKVADLLITDTSSVAYEYLALNRPIITYKAIARIEKGINIIDCNDLIGAIIRSFEDPEEYSYPRNEILSEIHPYDDGDSSKRLIEAIKEVIEFNELEQLKPKPRNWIRKKYIRSIVSK